MSDNTEDGGCIFAGGDADIAAVSLVSDVSVCAVDAVEDFLSGSFPKVTVEHSGPPGVSIDRAENQYSSLTDAILSVSRLSDLNAVVILE